MGIYALIFKMKDLMDNQEQKAVSPNVNKLKQYKWDIIYIAVPILGLLLLNCGVLFYICGRINFHLAFFVFAMPSFLAALFVFFFINFIRFLRQNVWKRKFLIFIELCLPLLIVLLPFVGSINLWGSNDPFLCGHRDHTIKKINIKEAQAWLKTIIDENGKFKKEISHDDIPEFLKKAGYYRIYIDEFENPLISSDHGGGFFHWGTTIGTEDMAYTESQINEKRKHDEEVLLIQPGFYAFAQY